MLDNGTAEGRAALRIIRALLMQQLVSGEMDEMELARVLNSAMTNGGADPAAISVITEIRESFRDSPVD